MDFREDLKQSLGLDTVEYKYGLGKDVLFEEAIRYDRGRIRAEGDDDEHKAYATALGTNGPLIFYSDPSCTGRPVQDTFGVAWPEVEDQVWWKDDFKRFDPAHIEPLIMRVARHLNDRRATLYVKDVYCGWDPAYAVPYRFVGEYATHAMFADNMFPKDLPDVEDEDAKRWTMLNVPSFHCDPERDGTMSHRAVILDFRNRIALVLGRADYCGVVKKSMFTVMNYMLPEFRATCRCTARPTSAPRATARSCSGCREPARRPCRQIRIAELIGDDEHAWTDSGDLQPRRRLLRQAHRPGQGGRSRSSPRRCRWPGTLIENVPPLPGKKLIGHGSAGPRPDRQLHHGEHPLLLSALTCNPERQGRRQPVGHPETIVLLTADAFGVLPPVAVLDPEGGDVPLRVGLHRQARRHGSRHHASRGPRSARASALRSWRRFPSVVRRGCLAEKMEQHQTLAASCSTPAGRGGHTAPASASRSATRAPC